MTFAAQTTDREGFLERTALYIGDAELNNDNQAKTLRNRSPSSWASDVPPNWLMRQSTGKLKDGGRHGRKTSTLMERPPTLTSRTQPLPRRSACRRAGGYCAQDHSGNYLARRWAHVLDVLLRQTQRPGGECRSQSPRGCRGTVPGPAPRGQRREHRACWAISREVKLSASCLRLEGQTVPPQLTSKCGVRQEGSEGDGKSTTVPEISKGLNTHSV